jgi:antitoxin ChpS
MTYKAKLRKVGGSVMLAIPPALLDALDLAADTQVGLAVKGGNLVVQPGRHRYSLDELIEQCKPSSRRSREDKNWTSGKPLGRELI